MNQQTKVLAFLKMADKADAHSLMLGLVGSSGDRLDRIVYDPGIGNRTAERGVPFAQLLIRDEDNRVGTPDQFTVEFHHGRMPTEEWVHGFVPMPYVAYAGHIGQGATQYSDRRTGVDSIYLLEVDVAHEFAYGLDIIELYQDAPQPVASRGTVGKRQDMYAVYFSKSRIHSGVRHDRRYDHRHAYAALGTSLDCSYHDCFRAVHSAGMRYEKDVTHLRS